MLSNAQSKYIRSLTQQKYRKQDKVFTVEGDKIAKEWLAADANVKMIVATDDWLAQHMSLVSKHNTAEVCTVVDYELAKVSNLQTPNQVLLVVSQPESSTPTYDGWSICVERLQDPGNMGTIIRIADWFGVQQVVASTDSVDFYNPKVIQAAMGGHLRVALHTTNLTEYVHHARIDSYAAVLGGDSIFDVKPSSKGILLIGNESKGLSSELSQIAKRKVAIPGRGGAESLNAGVATGILTAVLCRS